MPIDFPNSPQTGDSFSAGDKTWTHNGTAWVLTIGTVAIANDAVNVDKIDAGTATNNYVLKVNTAASSGLTWSTLSETVTLDGLSGVTISSPSNGQVLKYNGSAWVNDADATGTVINSLDDVGDVTIASAASGQFLKWNGSAWVNDAIDLGTETTGNYMVNVAAGTGISVSHTQGEGSTATVSINATLDNLSDVTVASPSNGQVLQYNGSAWVGAVVAGGATVSASAPASPQAGAIWFDSDDGKTYVYYSDGSSSQWVEIGGNPQAVTISDTSPASPITGQIWYRSDNGATYIYYDGFWVEVGGVSTNIVLNTIDAKGDLIVGTADNTISKLSAGTNGYVLAANSSTATGLEWTQVSSNPMTSNAAAMFIMDIGV
jgi:hypothetical protein